MFILLVILAFFVRLIIMPFSAHPDLFSINIYPSLLFKESVFDILSYVGKNVSEDFQYYPPMTYYTFASFQVVYQFFSPTFIDWMEKIRALEVKGVTGYTEFYIKNAPNPGIYRDLFLAKIPYLVFEIGSVLVLLKYFKKSAFRKKAIIIWLFNPVLLYAVYIFGQMEIIPTFFILLGFLLLSKNVRLALFILGIAAAYKNYAFVFILPTILIYADSWKKRLGLLTISLIPHVIFLIPTLISNPSEAVFSFVPKSFLNYRNKLEGYAFYSHVTRYILALFSYIFILFLANLLKLKNKRELSLGLSLVAMLLLITLVPRTHFHYLMWVMPLLFLWYRNVKILLIIIFTLGISFASYKILAPHLQAGLYAPINPNYFTTLPTFNDIINRVIPYRIVSTLGFLIFTFTSISMAALILKRLIFRAKTEFHK